MRLFELELKVAPVEEGERLALADEGAGVDEPDLETAADAKSGSLSVRALTTPGNACARSRG